MSKRKNKRETSTVVAAVADPELEALLEGTADTSAADAETAAAILASDDDPLAELVEEFEATSGDEATILSTVDLDTGIDKSALYAEQDSTVGVASDEDAAPVISEATAEAVAEVSKPEKRARASKGSGSTRSSGGGRSYNIADLTKLGFDEAEITGVQEGVSSAPKKVAEKATNLIRFSLGREHLSNYTRFTLEQLRDNPDGMTVVDLVKAMEARGYKGGTARSQSQQMSRLFGIYGMVDRTGKTMTLNRSHPFVKEALARLAGAPATIGASSGEDVIPAPEADAGVTDQGEVAEMATAA